MLFEIDTGPFSYWSFKKLFLFDGEVIKELID